MRMHQKLTFFSTLILLITLLGAVYYGSTGSRNDTLRQIDEKIYIGAIMAKNLLPEDFHDKLTGPNSISKDEYTKMIKHYNEICRMTGLQYLWSVIEDGGKIHFTSSTSPSHDFTKNDHAWFWDIHANPDFYKDIFKKKDPTYSSFKNEWGVGRTVTIPFKDRHGRNYAFSASMDISNVHYSLEQRIKNILIVGGLIIVAIFIITYLYTHHLTTPIHEALEILGENKYEGKELIRLRDKLDEVIDQQIETSVSMQEVNHRIKNNLQLLHSIINAEISKQENIETQQILKILANRLAGISKIHELLQFAPKNSKIVLFDFLEELGERFNEIYHNSLDIAFKMDFGTTMEIKESTAIQLGMFLNELIANTYKNRKTSSLVNVFISFQIIEDKKLMIQFTDSQMKNIKDLEGALKKTGVGLDILYTQINHLKGKFEIDDQSLKITIPVI